MRRKPGPYHVYRVFDRTGDLIYVGCSNNLFTRLAQHEELSWWAPQAFKVKSRIYPSYDVGLKAERLAIQTEHPRWNVGGKKWRRNRDWTQQHYVDYVYSCLNSGFVVDGTKRTITEIQKIYQHRFGAELRVPEPVVPQRVPFSPQLLRIIAKAAA